MHTKGPVYLIAAEGYLDGAVDGRVCDSDGVSQREEEKREPNDQNDREEKKTAETVFDDRATLRPARRGVCLRRKWICK